MRFFIGFIPIYIIIPKDKLLTFYKTSRPGLHTFRAISGAAAIIALFIGLRELPLADVANGGMVTGSALVGRRPFYIIRYQGYNWLNCIFIVNYACKSKEIWNKPAPMFIRGLSNEGGLGPASTSTHISIFYKMPNYATI